MSVLPFGIDRDQPLGKSWCTRCIALGLIGTHPEDAERVMPCSRTLGWICPADDVPRAVTLAAHANRKMADKFRCGRAAPGRGLETGVAIAARLDVLASINSCDGGSRPLRTGQHGQ